jgi:hypothetical protein
MGAWGPQYEAHEHRIDAEVDLETLPKRGSLVGRLDLGQVLGEQGLICQ